ncbi:MAG TPA: Mov34/MPN/PAD-1 family protein [Anaerolineae bacterium]
MTSASTYSKLPPDGGSRPATGDRRPATGNQRPATEHSEVRSLPERPWPLLAEKCLLHGTEPAAGQVRVIVRQAALEQIDAHSGSNLHSELGGALLGHAFRHGSTVFVDVAAALPAVSGDHGPIHFTFSADSWSQLQKDRAEQYPELAIVGWFHTHPGLGVFYSSDDVIVHSAAFTLPWHVGLVVDPVRQEACFFGWTEGELAPLAGFYEWTNGQETSAINWHVVRTAVWHGADGYGGDMDSLPAHERLTRRVYAPGSQWPALSPLISWLSLASGALGLLLGFFLLVGWVLPLTRQVSYLQSAVLTLSADGGGNHAACPDPHLRILAPVTGRSATAGTQIDVIGTAEVPEAARYRVEVRPSGTDTWSLVNARRRDTSLGLLAEWDTAPHTPAQYEMRLTAVDRNNVPLANTAPCLITVEVTP